MPKRPITVTKPSLPALEELQPYLEEIWANRILTNCGPLHEKLEVELRSLLEVERLALFSNATLALMVALKALDLSGEVITTPFTFVATPNALNWLRLDPVFVDIEPRTLNIDPERIERAITPRTSAILPVHCYGHPCDTAEIERIADKRGLRVIYDAAQAFGVSDEGGSILRHGNISVVSLHATKVFSTGEGGALICRDEATDALVRKLRNFGFESETSVTEPGLNAKMPELSAALGLAQLRHASSALERRRNIDRTYRTALSDVEGLRLLSAVPGSSLNYAYFPVLVEESFAVSRDELYFSLREAGIYTRRYFYPLVTRFPMYSSLPSAENSNLPTANRIAEQVICLPIYSDMTVSEQSTVIDVVCTASRRHLQHRSEK
jgi:dTDP-4-amino-4,6-dideoxygalactose transaminase